MELETRIPKNRSDLKEYICKFSLGCFSNNVLANSFNLPNGVCAVTSVESNRRLIHPAVQPCLDDFDVLHQGMMTKTILIFKCQVLQFNSNRTHTSKRSYHSLFLYNVDN